MRRMFLCAVALIVAPPAYASLFDDVQQTLYDADGKQLLEKYRTCTRSDNCTTVLSLCRWRPVNSSSKIFVEKESARVKLECKWPPPPATAPAAKCEEGLCVIPPDGRFY